ncbi:MAG: hypothetical protein MUE52_06655 [Tabrizicola sp.]|jgi:hypothetical protein|nr:hypothetical protein [Tabrizicola sp.]
MTITLTATGDNASELKQITNSTSAVFPVPLSKQSLLTALRAFLSDPESRDGGEGAIRLERRRDGVAVHHGPGLFLIGYPHLIPLILEG